MVEVVGELDFSETEVELERDGVVQVLVEVERIHHTCDEGGINGGPTKQAWSANDNRRRARQDSFRYICTSNKRPKRAAPF